MENSITERQTTVACLMLCILIDDYLKSNKNNSFHLKTHFGKTGISKAAKNISERPSTVIAN